MTNKIFKNEIMSEEQLDMVAGGNVGQMRRRRIRLPLRKEVV